MKLSIIFIFTLALVLSFGIVAPGIAQAAVGAQCTSNSDCAPYSCKSATDKPSTPSVIEGGFCGGPCTTDAQCAPVVAGLKWAAAKCTGTPAAAAVPGSCSSAAAGCTGFVPGSTPTLGTCIAGSQGCFGGSAAVPAVDGVCLELPRSESRLADIAPATTGAGLLGIVDTATNWVFAVFVALAIIFVLLAAFQFVTAGGDAAKVGEARQKLIWAAVGIIVALLAKGLVPVIKGIIGG